MGSRTFSYQTFSYQTLSYQDFQLPRHSATKTSSYQDFQLPRLPATKTFSYQDFIHMEHLDKPLSNVCMCWLAMPLVAGFLRWVLACRTIEKKTKVKFNFC